ncbi:MAG TPA: amidohydrolase family protein [Candidatus Rubrimentiphilum sp.]|nr:amidohydrolase family protein [Candidatus Rubrimentiphilum sp.]
MALLVRAGAIVTCDTDAPQNGVTFEQLGLIRDGSMLIDDVDGVILSLSKDSEQRNAGARVGGRADVLNFPDCVIVPGFVDAHTHPFFAGMRAPGETMLDTVRRTREALLDPAVFWSTVESRLKLMLAHGTTTAEVKTGYALTKAGELQMLGLIDAHKDEPELPHLIATFLGAHAVPSEFPDADGYTDYLIAEVLPEARKCGAVYADVFCEPGFFSPAQTLRYLNAARSHDLGLRAHCDEMSYSGAAAAAVQAGVDTVDHCNYIRKVDIEALVARVVMTVACPATTSYLGLPPCPVREILERGGFVALASDYNPGTSPCFNLQTVANYARRLYGLSASEALYGVTVAAAKSLRAEAGRIRVGGPADFVALRIGSPDEFGFQFGGNLAAAVFRGGRRIW